MPFTTRLIPFLVVLGLGLGLASGPARGADIDLKGAWKLVLLSGLRESEVFLIEIHEQGSKLEATVSGPGKFPEPPLARDIAWKDGTLSLTIKVGEAALTFRGKPAGPTVIKGALKINGQPLPVRLEKTNIERVEQTPQPIAPIVRDFITARNEQLPRTRVRLIRAVIAQKPGDPSLAPAYLDVLRDADAAELTADDVRKIVAQWIDGVKPFGDEVTADVQTQAALALAGKPAFAPITLKLARDADAALETSGSLQGRADIARVLADSARLTGDNALASTARAKYERLETEMDEAYHKAVPPFKPATSAGPKSRRSDRVVLLELFTGAECPPCVGADVAFDALNVSYKPAQLVTLQYHLHVPGPDPLANPDSLLRSEYYPDLRGTPSLYFDGKSHEIPTGGGMADSKDRYDEDRKLIDEALESPSRAALTLEVKRKGDVVSIKASASARAPSSKPGAGRSSSRLKLRLALIEEAVRYTGGNGLRFHHHLVRALPGGVDGKALADGKGTNVVDVDLAKLRKDLDRYLADYVKEGNAFRKAIPPIALDGLSVVAFVQDDEDKSVLNAIMTPVGKAD